MRTNVVLDDELVEQRMRLTKAKTKKELLNLALAELVKELKRKPYLVTVEKLNGKETWISSGNSVDSSVWIEYLGKKKGLYGRELERLIASDAEIAISDIIIMEVLQGIKDDLAEK